MSRTSTNDRRTIPARKGAAAMVRRGEVVEVINTHGQQVVDTWAFSADDIGEFMSLEHTRPKLLTALPKVGDTLLTNRRRPILTIVDDTSGGVHDTLMAACDRYRYEQLGCTDYHDNCTDNLAAAMRELGHEVRVTPSPLNLFMNVPIAEDGTLRFEPPVSTPGSSVSLRAEMDAIIAFSACPQDMIPVNGSACTPVEAHFVITGPDGRI